MKAKLILAAMAAVLMFSGTVRAEFTVTLSKVHLCCPACVKGVEKALKDVDDVEHKADRKTKTVTLVAKSDDHAQLAINALAAAGFHGKLNSKAVKFKAVDVPKGKVERLELSGVHNCCGACTRSIKKAIGKVDGVEGDSVQARKSSFVVEGSFSAGALVESLLEAGFHVKVKK